MLDKTTTNLTNFTPKGQLEKLFAQARTHNQINQILKDKLPAALKELELSTIKEGVAILVSPHQACAFRARQQADLIIQLLQSIPQSAQVQQVKIKNVY
jgi:hypothetical protein